MKSFQMDLPDELLLTLKQTPAEFSRQLRMAAVPKLYELGKLSSGRAAELAGMPRVAFLQAPGGYGVPIFELTKEELARDFETA
jgi:predicted HTH domain antitoxin